jgi:hypothetical protein
MFEPAAWETLKSTLARILIVCSTKIHVANGTFTYSRTAVGQDIDLIRPTNVCFKLGILGDVARHNVARSCAVSVRYESYDRACPLP